MSFFDKPFDSSKIEPHTAFKPIPEGNYLSIIKSASEDTTKRGDGKMLTVQFKILAEGPAKGREITWRINLENPNPQAVEIGHRQLSALCRGTGVQIPKRPGDFVNKTVTIKVKVIKRHDRPDELTNEVAGVVLPENPATSPVAHSPGPASNATAAAGEKPPWA